MTFDVAADSYDRFMGRYSAQLAPELADLGEVRTGQKALDVGCGPGALTTELVTRLGAESVAAVDPSEPFVAAARARHPGVEVQRASAEDLPYPDDEFDATLAQLVVHFMADPVAGLREMARVTRPGGVVAASVWDHAGERAPLTAFWRAALEIDDAAEDESGLAGARAGHLTELLEEAGLDGVEETELGASVEYSSFDDWWNPFTLGVGPAGAYAGGLDEARRSELRGRCRELLPNPPFTLHTFAWAARGRTA
ncbi:MAG: class I SAM-dependent methyltransferase [Actinomycetota bacterium]|nr:class I SAM-dependent methyltransferase [Actinomycetota bacterium]